MVYMTTGYPENKSFSVSRSFVAANAARSVLQKRHLRATALMVSPQTGQAFSSPSMIAPFRIGIITQNSPAVPKVSGASSRITGDPRRTRAQSVAFFRAKLVDTVTFKLIIVNVLSETPSAGGLYVRELCRTNPSRALHLRREASRNRRRIR